VNAGAAFLVRTGPVLLKKTPISYHPGESTGWKTLEAKLAMRFVSRYMNSPSAKW
jgi:hypothetical protein